MTPSERIDTLVKMLEGNNAKVFADKTNIPPSSLCRVRRGIGKPETYFDRIVKAYPQVRKQWLYSGIGEPLKEKKERGEVLAKIESLEKEVKRLAGLVEELLLYQKSTNQG